LRLNNSVKF